jgi:hypothetical protein
MCPPSFLTRQFSVSAVHLCTGKSELSFLSFSQLRSIFLMNMKIITAILTSDYTDCVYAGHVC